MAAIGQELWHYVRYFAPCPIEGGHWLGSASGRTNLVQGADRPRRIEDDSFGTPGASAPHQTVGYLPRGSPSDIDGLQFVYYEKANRAAVGRPERVEGVIRP